MRLLVAGGDRVDAGKTTFSAGLCERLGAVGYKPRAGNDYWFDHDDYRHAVEAGRLYGKDARRLAAASAADVTPEAINPAHRLWRPAPDGDQFIGRAGRQFVCDRVGDEYVVNAGADVPDSARESLPLDGALQVTTVADLNEVIRERHHPAFGRLADRIAGERRAVVESYADIARPVDRSFDAVAVVEPERVRVFDGDDYAAAADAAAPSERDGAEETRVPAVTARADPRAALALPALDSDTRGDPAAVADAYEVAYDALLAAAV
jgi:predicted P-loop ATPase/GTPase